jgi:hypothetical protein
MCVETRRKMSAQRPMLVACGSGGMLLVTRFDGDEFSARFLCGAAFYEFSGARDPEVSGRLEQAIARDRGAGSNRCVATITRKRYVLGRRAMLLPVQYA